jgi:nucleoside-diphosphate-sugar epimerase
LEFVSVENLRPFYEGKKVLITGGAGLIGSYTANALVEIGAEVIIYDLQKSNNPLITQIEGDILDYGQLKSAMEGVEYVFHFAALLGVERIEKTPYDVLRVNLEGTINALKAANECKVKRFLFSSSSEVYGEPEKIPISEEDKKAPLSIYGVSKLAAEAYCEAYFKQFGLPITIVRYFNVYGPGQKEYFVMPIFASRVAQGLPPIIYGHGEQVRCFTYVEDAVRGTLLAACAEKAVGEAFNIGQEEETTVKELAEFFIQISGLNCDPLYKPFNAMIRGEKREIFNRKPDILKARANLGYKPVVKWRTGAQKMYEYYLEKFKLNKKE